MPKGLIIKGVGGFYEVWLDAEERLVTCKPRGIFRKDQVIPHVGDHVEVEESGKCSSIIAISERKNLLRRPPVANIDQLAVVVSASTPTPDLPLVDRMFADAGVLGIQPILVVNKTDEDQDRLTDISRIYHNTGITVIPVSAKTRAGTAAFEQLLNGRTTALAGQSGVGKSTLLNAVFDELRMETGVLSEKGQRGKHTTRHVELVRLVGGGYVCDTPGFSQFENEGISYDMLDQYYPEFAEALGKCRYTGCSHLAEPDCAVKELVSSGFVSPERYEGYRTIYEHIKLEYQNRYRRK